MNAFLTLPVLMTERLRLRALKTDDAAALFAYQSNKDHFPHVDMAIYTHESEATAYIERMAAGVTEGKWLIWAIADRTDDRILGTLSLWNFDWEKRVAEFGYGLFPEVRGKGYMQEALAAAIAFGFDILELEVLEAYTAITNTPSIQLLEKLRFEQIGEMDEEGASGTVTHLVIYGLKRRI